MNIKRSLITSITSGVNKVAKLTEYNARNRHNMDIALSWALQRASNKNILFPSEYVEFLRGCMESKNLRLREIKSYSGGNDNSASKRFATLVDTLRSVPPIDFISAEEIALISDSIRGNFGYIEGSKWAGDVASLFGMSSSFGKKGRILSAIVRFTQSKSCLELGTAYGMSALFMLETLKYRGEDVHLTTLEGSEYQYAVSSKILKERYDNKVTCHVGWTYDVLPDIVKSLTSVDFLFHDAGHTKKDYVNDFHAVLPVLPDGAAVLIDDIRWDDPRFSDNPRCYEGWREVVNHSRVRRAVEIDDDMGLLLLGP
jgi:predicted O-methyltransferase YrrM